MTDFAKCVILKFFCSIFYGVYFKPIGTKQKKRLCWNGKAPKSFGKFYLANPTQSLIALGLRSCLP